MPQVQIDETLTLHYELDNFTDPWTTPETILLIHGVADTSKAWFAWIPHLARRYRILRPDLRGFGQSTIPPREYQWSLAGLAKDLNGLLDQLGIAAVHVVGQREPNAHETLFQVFEGQRFGGRIVCIDCVEKRIVRILPLN